MDTWDSDTYGLDLQFTIRETVCTKASGRDPFTCDFRTGPFVVGAPARNGNPSLPPSVQHLLRMLLVLGKEGWLADFGTSCSMDWVSGGKDQWWETLLPAQWAGQGAVCSKGMCALGAKSEKEWHVL